MRFHKNVTIVGWGNDPTDPSRLYSTDRVIGIVEANLMNWLAKRNKSFEELAMVEQRRADLVAIRATTAEKWAESTGIRTRQIYFDDSIGTTELAIIAAENALASAAQNDSNFSREKIGLIVSGSASFADAYPDLSCVLQDKLGIPSAGALFLSGACCSGTEAFIAASALLQTGCVMYALVVSSEKVASWFCDFMDKNALLWGDGASALVIKATIGDNPNFGLLGMDMLAYGNLSGTTRSRGLGAHPDHRNFPANNASMEGRARELHRWASQPIAKDLERYVGEEQISVNDRTFLIPHHGNKNIGHHCGERVGIPPERVLSQIEVRANMSSASAFHTTAHYANQGFFRKGDLIIYLTFGGGAKRNICHYRWG